MQENQSRERAKSTFENPLKLTRNVRNVFLMYACENDAANANTKTLVLFIPKRKEDREKGRE